MRGASGVLIARPTSIRVLEWQYHIDRVEQSWVADQPQWFVFILLDHFSVLVQNESRNGVKEQRSWESLRIATAQLLDNNTGYSYYLSCAVRDGPAVISSREWPTSLRDVSIISFSIWDIFQHLTVVVLWISNPISSIRYSVIFSQLGWSRGSDKLF